MSSMLWTVLGSSSGTPSRNRACSGYILSVENSNYMFDCGSGVISSFLRLGFDPLNLDAIFISHTHSDHISDLSLFIQLQYLLKRTNELKIYLPEEAVEPFLDYLNMVYLFPEKFMFPLSLLPVEKECSINNNINIRSIPNEHLSVEINEKIIFDRRKVNRMSSYSYEIIINRNKRILYSADIASLDELDSYVHGIDLFVLETTHIDLNVLPKWLAGRNVRHLILTHISDDSFASISQFALSFKGDTEFLVARDGLSVAF